MSDSSKAADRTLGLLIAISGGIAFLAFRKWTNRRSRDLVLHLPGSDEIHNVRYALQEKLIHNGSCHCERIQFRVRAPRVLNAFDMQSKVRFPRLVIKCEDFENISDENNLSLYAVTNGSNIGIHAFCSYCGVHVLYSPAEDPKEIQINVDCLETKNIEKINVSYFGRNETIACDLSDARARLYTRTRHSLGGESLTLPPPMSRTPSRGLTGVASPHGGAPNDADYCSESLSELLVEGVDDMDSEKDFSRLAEERREMIESSPHETYNHKVTPGGSRYRQQNWSSGDWERNVAPYNSWSTNSPWQQQEDSSNSNSLSNYTTSESLSGNDLSSKDGRRGIERSATLTQSWNPGSGIETPTSALHRRLKTFLRRHMPQDRTNPSSVSSTSSLISNRLEQHQQQYNPYEGSAPIHRWRR